MNGEKAKWDRLMLAFADVDDYPQPSDPRLRRFLDDREQEETEATLKAQRERLHGRK